ncbi:MAG: HAD family phosphatase [Clostridiales bacterium]|nr:HAD family phosphatase [Clostridiales bacterium]
MENLTPDMAASIADLLIFDLDGTILDSMDLWNRVDIAFLSKRGFQVTEEYTDIVKSRSMEDAAVYTKEAFGLRESPEEIMDEWNTMVGYAYAKEVALKPGVMEYLERASSLGLKLAFATALAKEHAYNALSNNGILNMFECGKTLEDVGKKTDKRDPFIYLSITQRLNIPPRRTIVYEDVPAALEGARKGGFITCCVYDSIGSGDLRTWEDMKSSSHHSVKSWQI